MAVVHGIQLPTELELLCVRRNAIGETNEVFLCQAELCGQPLEVYVKVARGEASCLPNEHAVLDALKNSPIPVPRVIWYAPSPQPVLILEALPGSIIWDHLDPRRGHYHEREVPAYLREYGRCLAHVHGLPLAWAPQQRSALHELIGEQDTGDPRFEALAQWLRCHLPPARDQVFVHGDFNTASVLCCHQSITGVIDWEFAGCGWREYDLAWILRARRTFLNTPAEREAILEGYRSSSSYDEQALRYCEVLNYLHFAYWSRKDEPEYEAFALDRASEIASR